jgi:hypothetical protein
MLYLQNHKNTFFHTRKTVTDGIKRVLPSYLISTHKSLKIGVPYTPDYPVSDGHLNFTFKDGRSLRLECSPEGLLIKEDFISPILLPENIKAAVSQEGIIEWETLPGSCPSAHTNIKRRSSSQNETFFFMDDITGHIHIRTQFYSLYLRWSLGQHIYMNISNRAPSDSIVPQETLEWSLQSEKLEIIKRWIQKNHPYKYNFMVLQSYYENIAQPIKSFFKKNN